MDILKNKKKHVFKLFVVKECIPMNLKICTTYDVEGSSTIITNVLLIGHLYLEINSIMKI